MNPIQTKNYNAIDIMKFICSILVIIIHTSPLASYNENLNFAFVQVIARIAVPFFFTAAGFFFFRKVSLPLSSSKNNSHILFKYIIRLLKIYLVWTAIYYIYRIFIVKTESINKENITTYIKDFIFSGSNFHLWYLPAIISAVLITYFLLKFLSIKKVLIIAIAFYIIGLLGESYYGFISKTKMLSDMFESFFSFFATMRDGLFFGFMFVAIGAYIGKYEMKIKKPVILLIISFCLLFIEAFLLKSFQIARDYNMMISIVPITVLLFNILINVKQGTVKQLESDSEAGYYGKALGNDCKAVVKPSATVPSATVPSATVSSLEKTVGNENKIYRYLRDSSIIIYCSHIIIGMILPNVFAALKYDYYSNSLFPFFITTLCTVIFSFAIVFLSKIKVFKFLKIFY